MIKKSPAKYRPVTRSWRPSRWGCISIGNVILSYSLLAPTIIVYTLIIFVLGALISFNRLKVVELLHQTFPDTMTPPPITPQAIKQE
ncbi:MAG: hypothetical protein SGI98_01375 [Verrucomicrobiota bacterium]|nr:hypothetical protein [Verrucomicrobiota bacterium]